MISQFFREPIRRNRVWELVLLASAGCTPATELPRSVPSPVTVTSRVDDVTETTAKANAPTESLTGLLSLIRERLELMPLVAQAKWNRKSPVTDPVREATSLAELQAKGVERGLPAELVREFFQAQMTAAKLIQEELMTDWMANQQPPFPNPPDLANEIRPKIDQLNEQLLDALLKCCQQASTLTWKSDLTREKETFIAKSHWPETVVQIAFKPLTQITTTALGRSK
jgi:chorismate mutase-like protein